jgi:hypothetical protein
MDGRVGHSAVLSREARLSAVPVCYVRPTLIEVVVDHHYPLFGRLR